MWWKVISTILSNVPRQPDQRALIWGAHSVFILVRSLTLMTLIAGARCIPNPEMRNVWSVVGSSIWTQHRSELFANRFVVVSSVFFAQALHLQAAWPGLTLNHSIAVDTSPFRRNWCRSAYRGSLVQRWIELFNTSQRAGYVKSKCRGYRQPGEQLDLYCVCSISGGLMPCFTEVDKDERWGWYVTSKSKRPFEFLPWHSSWPAWGLATEDKVQNRT